MGNQTTQGLDSAMDLSHDNALKASRIQMIREEIT